MLIPAVGGTPRELWRVDGDWSRMAWTPDSRWLIVSARESEDEPYSIWLLSPATGEHRRLIPSLGKIPRVDDRYGDHDGALSPDGKVLVFARNLSTATFKLYAVWLTEDMRPQGAAQSLTDQRYHEISGITFTSQREIIFGVWAGGLYRMSVSTGVTPEKLNGPGSWTKSPAVTPSRHRLVYVESRSSRNLWRLNIRTGEYTMLIGSSYMQQHPQYSPDGHRIAFESASSGILGIWTCDSDGENCQDLTSLGGAAGGTPRWSPDGRWIAYDSREEGNSQIYIIPSDGGPKRRLTSGGENMLPSWSRDGRWIYFDSGRSGVVCLWKIPANGGEAVQVTRIRTAAAFESVDQKYLYFYSQQAGANALFRVALDGGNQKMAAPVGAGWWEDFAVTGKGVYFLSDRKTLQLLDERTGSVRTVAILKGREATGGITVSPDDTYLVFGGEINARNDLMLVEGFR